MTYLSVVLFHIVLYCVQCLYTFKHIGGITNCELCKYSVCRADNLMIFNGHVNNIMCIPIYLI